MGVFNYYVVRYSSQALYTFEFVIALAAWILVLVLWRRTGDRRPLAAYVIGGLYDTGVELLAQGSGVRAMPEVRLFGVVPIGFPVLPFILGFFEGGVLLLAGFQIVRGVLERDRRALRVGLGIVLGLAAIIVLASLGMKAGLATDPQAFELTARALFSKGSLVILSLCYALSIGYALLNLGGDGRDRRGLLLWYLAVAVIAATWYTPAFLAGTRGIASLEDGAYVRVSLVEQIAVLYGYSIVFEAAGFYLPVYVILRLCRLL
jgi:hypothetical protein